MIYWSGAHRVVSQGLRKPQELTAPRSRESLPTPQGYIWTEAFIGQIQSLDTGESNSSKFKFGAKSR